MIFKIASMWIGLLLCAGAVLVANASPHAADIEQLIGDKKFIGRISDNISEDARMDVPDLVAKYRYPLEVHNVVTRDGYILTMHRIPHGRDQNNNPNVKKPVIFLMHGLLSSSADWVLMGPGCAFGYILAEAGYDVWMGNARGNYYSRQHLRLRPDALLNTDFWEFSWDEIGNIDLPIMIDYTLKTTGQERLHYIGHSQGTTAFFVMASLRPEYNQKIISMHAMAPVAYLANSASLLLRAIAQFSSPLDSLARLIGMGEFLPNNAIMTWAGHALCMDEVSIQQICSNILFLVGGWNEAQHNRTMLPVKLGHTPAGASVRQFVHYGQSIADKTFKRFDHGRLKNRRVYGSYRAPAYDLSKITVPVFLHYSASDPLAHVNDVDRLFRELGRPVGKFRISDRSFSHLDFLWGVDAKPLLFDRIINLVQAMDVNGFDDVSDLRI
ncbi:lipase 3-like [Leguminivora glycinivorella]|uniref:lipase 3-like n=1 Tax=Leguminivora glycinivorella TaxID=1035111 RepID=UPI0020108BB9|nr:lipase 3-like [Leguminivora glycinivorella]